MRWSEPLGGILLCLVLLGCQPQMEPSAEAPPVTPPPGFPPVPVPPDNPITAEQRELGRRLFYDPAVLSPNGTIACASCHRQARAFSDALALSAGIHGRKHWRSTLPLFNVAYAPALLWDGSIASIEEDVLVTLRAALTLGWRDTTEFAQRLRESPSYRAAFRRAFGQEPSALLAARAIATFVRTIFSGASAYDRFRQGDSSALTPAQQRGMRIFFRVGCAECHPPPLFTDYQYHATGMLAHYWKPVGLRLQAIPVITPASVPQRCATSR
jgi:cytochrome c peroxidase